MKKEISAGGIVFRIAGRHIYVLMIRDHNNKYTFPKGHVDSGETPEITALRETREETGLKNIRIVNPLGTMKFFYIWQNEKILKTVHFFLVKTNEKKLTPQLSEIKGAEWVLLENVLEKSGYANQKTLIRKADKTIKELMK